jgi:F-type H+-transporting ATPase subunit delta
MLRSPVVKISDKIKVLNALFSSKVNNITLGLFHLLQDNKRIAMLHSIAKQYAIIYDFDKRMQDAKVTTAVPLTKEIEAKILAKTKLANQCTQKNTLEISRPQLAL